MNQLIMALATGFYVGRIPIAPGTWGSLAAFLPWFFIKDLSLTTYIIVLAALFVIGFFVSGSAEKSETEIPSPRPRLRFPLYLSMRRCILDKAASKAAKISSARSSARRIYPFPVIVICATCRSAALLAGGGRTGRRLPFYHEHGIRPF